MLNIGKYRIEHTDLHDEHQDAMTFEYLSARVKVEMAVEFLGNLGMPLVLISLEARHGFSTRTQSLRSLSSHQFYQSDLRKRQSIAHVSLRQVSKHAREHQAARRILTIELQRSSISQHGRATCSSRHPRGPLRLGHQPGYLA